MYVNKAGWQKMLVAAGCVTSALAWAQSGGSSVVYRCPGNVYTSDRELTAKQADEKGCKLIEGAPVTVIQGQRPRVPGTPVQPASGPRPAGDAGAKVEPSQQRARDSDARRILEDELKKEEERLAALQKEYNNGEPERRGDERNYQKYLERVAELKAAVARKENDIAAIKREITKLPP
jgi:hypothetical protein